MHLRQRRLSFVLLCIIVVGTLLSACRTEDENSAGETVTADLGIVLTLTGPSSVFGLSSKAGIELALAEINDENAVPGVRINATFVDDTGTAARGAKLFGELVADETVDVLFGPSLSNTALSADPVAQAAGVPVIAISNTVQGITDIGDYIFRVPLSDDAVIPVVVATVSATLIDKTAALIHATDDAFSTSTADLMRAAAAANGIELVTEQTFVAATTDFTAQLDAIAEAAPAIIFLAALDGPAALIVSQARTAGLSQQFVCGNGCNVPQFLEITGPAAEGLVVGASWNIHHDSTASREFVEAYRAQYASDPDQFAAQAYASTYLLAHALRAAGSSDRDDIRDALRNLTETETPLGLFRFDQQRNPVYAPVVQQIVNGQLVPIDGD